MTTKEIFEELSKAEKAFDLKKVIKIYENNLLPNASLYEEQIIIPRLVYCLSRATSPIEGKNRWDSWIAEKAGSSDIRDIGVDNFKKLIFECSLILNPFFERKVEEFLYCDVKHLKDMFSNKSLIPKIKGIIFDWQDITQNVNKRYEQIHEKHYLRQLLAQNMNYTVIPEKNITDIRVEIGKLEEVYPDALIIYSSRMNNLGVNILLNSILQVTAIEGFLDLYINQIIVIDVLQEKVSKIILRDYLTKH